MAAPSSCASSFSLLPAAHTQVPLLIPPELQESVLSGAAEIVLERGARSRCFLHIFSEEERRAAVQAATDGGDAVRAAHERCLEELRWARGVLWADTRIRRFVRCANHLAWPAHEQLSRVAAVVRQLVLCDGAAAAYERANELARATLILEREATQPGLHPLTESALEGQAVVYAVEQTRKRERDAAAPSMPSVLSRVAGEAVQQTAWIAELKHVSYAASDVLQLQLGLAPLTRLVELLRVPSPSAPAATPASSSPSPPTVRQEWKALVERHRASAEFLSLFADVAETCLSWGAAEAAVAAAVGAAADAGRSVHLRIGVHATVLQRRERFVLLCPGGRRLESVTAAEQSAVAASLGGRSWAQCVEEGLVCVAQRPAGELSLTALETVARQRFLSPVLLSTAVGECCAMDPPVVVHDGLVVVRLSAPFNPFVVLHGSRVDKGFQGDEAYCQSLQLERDRLVLERTDEELRRGYAESVSRSAAGPGGAAPAAPTPSRRVAVAAPAVSEQAAYLFKRSLISALSVAPLSKAELAQHPAMQQFKSEGSFDVLLNAKLKEVAELKGRRYQLRN